MQRRAIPAAGSRDPGTSSATVRPSVPSREVEERLPTGLQLRIDQGILERVGEGGLRVQRLGAGLVPPVEEPTTLEIDPRQPERTLRVPTGDPDEVVVDVEGCRGLGDP